MLNSPFTCMPMVRLLAHWMLALEPLLRAFTTELTRVGELQTDASDPWSHVELIYQDLFRTTNLHSV